MRGKGVTRETAGESGERGLGYIYPFSWRVRYTHRDIKT
jgi:hypothetical protein